DGRPAAQAVPRLQPPEGVEPDDLLPDRGVVVATEALRQVDQGNDAASDHRGAPGGAPDAPLLRGVDEVPHRDLELRPEARSARCGHAGIEARARAEADPFERERRDGDLPSLVELADDVPRRAAH